jgi:hypothetical protein
MSERMNIEKAKDFWFGGYLTVCTLAFYDDEIWALPEIEVERGSLYLQKLESCKTFWQAQDLYEVWINDPIAPRFLPKELIDLKSLVEEPWEDLRDKPFDFRESPYYRDDNDQFVTIGRPQLWTDSWMPIEITELLGIPDEGYGIDYVPAEYIFRGRDEFKRTFESFGFEVLENDPKLRTIAGY